MAHLNHKLKCVLIILILIYSVTTIEFQDANEPQRIFGQGNKQISDINILLPISHCVDCRKAAYNISAINGCYTWEVSHPNMLGIIPMVARNYQDCANIAQITALSQKPSKSLIWITAKDRNSGQILRCETKIGVISKITIQTHFKQFYVEDYQHLEVAAFDDEGNIFSSLEGLRFDWNIEQGTDVVKMVTMKEASHKSSDILRDMEQQKLHSDMLFLKGLRTGTATLSVKIMEPGYESVQMAYVTLTITEPFVVIPSKTVYLLPTSKFQFKLAKVSLSNNDMQYFPIRLPSRQYEWNVDSEEKADIGEDGLFISKDKEGFVQVIVVDQFIANNTAEGSVKIVHPSLLDIEIEDVTQIMQQQTSLLSNDKSFAEQLGVTTFESNWILVENNIYLMKVYLYDRDKQLIELTDNLVFSNIINTEHLEIVKVNKINSEILVRAIKATKDKIIVSSTLKEIISQSPYYTYPIEQFFIINLHSQNRLKSEKEVRITKPITILHPTNLVLLPLLVVPSDPTKSGELWQLQAEGGSGYYQWSIVNTAIAEVSLGGLIRSKEIGKTMVLVRDSMNLKNQKTIDLEVASVFQLTWLEDHLEVAKNNGEAELNAIALDQKGRKFTNCTGVQVQFEVKGEGILLATPSSNIYEDIREYVLNNEELQLLKQRFEDHPTVVSFKDLPSPPVYSEQQKNVLFHNNFGICQQTKIKGLVEGLGRVKAYFGSYYSATQSRLIESNYAEVASFEKPTTQIPNYLMFFADLHSRHLVSQDESQVMNFNKLYIEGTFTISFGSSIDWHIKGGTNFWKDIPEKYQTFKYPQILDGQGTEQDLQVFHIDNAQELPANFVFSLSCSNPPDKSKDYHFKVNLKQQNQLTKHLLRPVQHEISINVQCEPPKSLKLYWAQEEKRSDFDQIGNLALKHLPRYKAVNNQKTYFVLVNSRHYVRGLMLDLQEQVFFNYSSIFTEFKSSDEQRLTVKNMAEGQYDDQVNRGVYDKVQVDVMNLTGVVYINGVSTGYLTRYLSGKPKGYFSSASLDTESLGRRTPDGIRDQLRVEIVQNVDIQPKFKSIYLHRDNSYRFQILHGSGHFSVSVNNSDICERHHIEGDRYITIYPKKEGPVEIRVEDLEIPDSVVATAELLISDIFRLEIDTPGTLIEQGSQMELTVTAFDTYNNQFDEDQYNLMKFHIEIEQTQHREKGLLAEQVMEQRSNNRIFNLKGQDPGLYQITAVSLKFQHKSNEYQDRKRVSSEMLKIEVFPLLQIQPGSLLLTPQMKYTLQIVGGPSRTTIGQNSYGGAVEIKFDVEDKSIATVDVFREITGQDVGDTRLFYEIIQLKVGSQGERRSIISKKTIPIRVRLVTDIEIPYNNQRTVYSASMIKLIAVLKYQNEFFTHGIAPISYSWNCSNPNILQLSLPQKTDVNSGSITSTLIMASKNIRNNEISDNSATFLTAFNSSTIYTVGGKQGEALVSLQLAIEYPYKYRYEKNWFSTKIIVRVNEKLTVEVPEYIHNQEKQTHLYMVPPNTYTKIETNKKTRLRLGYSQQSVYDYSTDSYQYKDSSVPIIQLVNDEGIKTFDKYGKVTVIIEENQAFSDQVVMLNVLITDIYNLAVKDAYSALSFPLGSQMSIPIKFQNDHAHSFAKNIEGIEVGIELSHPRVVSATLDQYNQSVIMRAEGSGECNVVLYLVKHPHIFDVFRVRVSSVVKPYSPVHMHVGGQVTFKIMNSPDYIHGAQAAKEATWSSNNPSVIDINQATGEARALSEGRAEILLSNHISAASIAYVSKVQHGEIDEQSRKNLIINTDEFSGETRVRVKLYLHDQMEELMPTLAFDGMTLIKQNVVINCQSEQPEILEAKGQVSDLEGFFCILNYKSSYSRQVIPKSVKVHVTVFAPNPQKQNDLRASLYSQQILSFDVSFVSRIQIESYYRNGVYLNRDQRSSVVKIYSNTHFNVQVENERESDKGFTLLKYRVNKTDEDSTEYNLYLTVPQEITHDFESNIYIIHPSTGQKTTIPVQFKGRESSSSAYYRPARASDNEGGILSGLWNVFSSGEERKPTRYADDEKPIKQEAQQIQISHIYRKQTKQREEYEDYKGEVTPLGTILLWVLLILLALFFLMTQIGIDPVNAVQEWVNGTDHRRFNRIPSHLNQSINQTRSFQDLPRGGISSSMMKGFPQRSPVNDKFGGSPMRVQRGHNTFGAVSAGRQNYSGYTETNRQSIFGTGGL